MTRYDWAALASLLYLAWELGCLRVRVRAIEKTLDSNGIYL